MFTAIRNLLLVMFLVPLMSQAREPDAPHTSAEWHPDLLAVAEHLEGV